MGGSILARAGFLPLCISSLIQRIGVPWFRGWQWSISGVTGAVLRTGGAIHALTVTLDDGKTRRPIAHAPVAVRHHTVPARGSRVGIPVPGYQAEEAVIRDALSFHDPTRSPAAHRTCDGVAVYPTACTGQPGPLVSLTIRDTTIREHPKWRAGNWNGGTLPITLQYGRSNRGEDRTVIQFHHAQIPTKAQAVEAASVFCVWEFHGDPLLAAVYPLNRRWDERAVTRDTYRSAHDCWTKASRQKLVGLAGGPGGVGPRRFGAERPRRRGCTFTSMTCPIRNSVTTWDGTGTGDALYPLSPAFPLGGGGLWRRGPCVLAPLRHRGPSFGRDGGGGQPKWGW
jgi:hypothetical protein